MGKKSGGGFEKRGKGRGGPDGGKEEGSRVLNKEGEELGVAGTGWIHRRTDTAAPSQPHCAKMTASPSPLPLARARALGAAAFLSSSAPPPPPPHDRADGVRRRGEAEAEAAGGGGEEESERGSCRSACGGNGWGKSRESTGEQSSQCCCNVNLVTKSTVSHLAGETSRISRIGLLGTPSSR